MCTLHLYQHVSFSVDLSFYLFSHLFMFHICLLCICTSIYLSISLSVDLSRCLHNWRSSYLSPFHPPSFVSPVQRHKLGDRWPSTTACPACWVIGTSELKYCTAKAGKKSLVSAREAQRTNLGRAPFLCTLWGPIHLSFNSQGGPPLSSLSGPVWDNTARILRTKGYGFLNFHNRCPATSQSKRGSVWISFIQQN